MEGVERTLITDYTLKVSWALHFQLTKSQKIGFLCVKILDLGIINRIDISDINTVSANIY